MTAFDLHAPHVVARLFVGVVWLVFGLGFKVLRGLPRHERIVARILGPTHAAVLTRLIGVGETCLGLWMISGILTVPCALVQTVIVATMNAIELKLARDLLLAPVPMLAANAALTALAWFAALGG